MIRPRTAATIIRLAPWAGATAVVAAAAIALEADTYTERLTIIYALAAGLALLGISAGARLAERVTDGSIERLLAAASRAPITPVEAMRAAGWSDNEVGAAMDGRYRGRALDEQAHAPAPGPRRAPRRPAVRFPSTDDA